MALTYTRRRLSSSAREALYDRCRGDNEFPTCNICKLPVDGVHQAWDESHDPDGPPHCFGGTETGVAHRDCNRRHGAEVVVPMDAKATRIRQNFIGASVSRFPMPGGRNSRIKKKIGGGVVVREQRVPKLSMDDFDRLLAAVNVEMALPSPWDRFITKVEQLVGRDLTETEIAAAVGAFEIDQTASDYALRVQALEGAT